MPRRRTLITTTTATALALLVSGLGATAARADTSAATDLYVNSASATTCSDAGPGTAAQPFCGIQAAADVVTPGQTVHVAGASQAYPAFTLTRSGTPDAPIRFVHSQSTTAGTNISSTVAGGIAVSGAHDISFSGINVTNGSTSTVQSPLVLSNAQNVTFDRSILAAGTTKTADAISVDGASSGVTLSRLEILAHYGWGIDIQSGATSVNVAEDLIGYSGAVQGGVHADGVKGVTLAGDTISSLCGTAVSLTGDTSGSVENLVAVAGGNTAAANCGGFGPTTEISVSASAAPQVLTDYNVIHSGPFGTNYVWGGTAYPTSAALTAAYPGQAAHDLNTNTGLVGYGNPAEGAVSIDSGDAAAPGRLDSDYHGNPVVDDPLVTDSGTGHVDRGAFEFQPPVRIIGFSPASAMVSFPVTLTLSVVNPWNFPLLYHVDFGDGTVSQPSTSLSATHTYAAAATDSGALTATYYVTRADNGALVGQAAQHVTVNPIPDLAADFGVQTDPSVPDTATVGFLATSVYGGIDNLVNFGDGTAAAHVTGASTTHHYAHPGTYTVTDVVTDAHGRTATTSHPVTAGASFVSILFQQRILDTRRGIGAPARKVGPGGVLRLKVAGRGGLPATGVTAVTMNVTDTDATADSYVSAYPDGGHTPTVSNLNFRAGQINPNLVTVTVGADGYVDLYNRAGSVNLIADVQGYYTTTANTPTATGNNLYMDGPRRVLNTLTGQGAAKRSIGPRGRVTFSVADSSGGAPNGTMAVLLNVTAVGGTAPSYVAVDTIGPNGTPDTSVLNFRPGQTTSNLVVVPTNLYGQVTLYNSAGNVNLIADVQGFYDYTAADHSYVPLAPVRVLDTRYGTGARAGTVGPHGTVRVKVTGAHGVPAGVSSVLVNLTGVSPTARTYLTAFAGGSVPGTSNLDLLPGETRPVLTAVPVDADGYITVYNAQGWTHVIVDLEGYTG